MEVSSRIASFHVAPREVGDIILLVPIMLSRKGAFAAEASDLIWNQEKAESQVLSATMSSEQPYFSGWKPLISLTLNWHE